MPTPQEAAAAASGKINVFDENGQTVETLEADTAGEVTAEVETPTDAAPAREVGKYRIGDRMFETQEAALEYAQSQVSALETEAQVADAYRQGMRDALPGATPPAASVTPAAPALDTQELYTNPQAFLDKFANKIKTETRSELDHKEMINRQSEQIWSEFTQRHPMLADFRSEVENFAAQNQAAVQAVIATKGQSAGYDFVATKIKANFERYQNALKPKRELPNTGAGASPSGNGTSVTPKTDPKKVLSFSEQVKSIRRRR